MQQIIEGYLGKSAEGKKSKMPAKLDFIQSASGLFLGLFMWGHMFFVSSILISSDFMYRIAKMFEGDFIFGTPQPWVVSCIVFVVFVVFVVHAGLAMRKFPINFRQWQLLRTHAKVIKHSDTNLWFIQAITGFIMFFFASLHLGLMFFQAHTIDPYGSGDRMLQMWPFYLILLFAVELHGGIGLYRLCVKWGWFEGKNAKASRKTLKKLKWLISVFFIALGLLTMAAYVKVGLSDDHKAGDRYVPTYMQR
ncbi:fumarate reductase cytochrome subunit b [Campylobacter sp. MIT 12-8780]|uniref:fumarate reductase cytochrome b subunit n=1 Tax=Campylobacter sp. MIT 12-8780 TaxID=2202200 RepID=UPI00115E530C|nr:fumarate reductase cytochrome b subunit [Campylobacter sp. MIT 12-8780]TQR43089.1 fumarate reductase cytochrome subunit b [Campylobacter sp. MIT 12-8780]